VRLHFAGEPRGFFKIAERLVAGGLEKDFAEDLARLKANLETPA
jgi:hypothetical protein